MFPGWTPRSPPSEKGRVRRAAASIMGPAVGWATAAEPVVLSTLVSAPDTEGGSRTILRGH